jgi:AraC-like DNA-binding protein
MPVHPENVITSRLAPLMLVHLRTLGRPVEGLMRTFGLPANSHEREAVRMTVDAFESFSEAAAELARDDYFGLTLAQSLPRGGYGLLEFAGRTALTLNDALGVMIRTLGLPGEPVQFDAAVSTGGATFTQRVKGHPRALGRHGNEFTLAFVLRLGREAANAPVSPRRVWFAHSAPKDLRPLVEYFGTAALSFGAGENGATFSATVLDHSVRGADASLHRALIRQLEVQKPSGTKDVVEAVQAIVVELLETPGALVSIERVAARLQKSARSLQRDLSLTGASFRKLVEQARMLLAESYLSEEDTPISEVAERLNFADARSFARAFRRWTQMAPGEFRARRLKAGA